MTWQEVLTKLQDRRFLRRRLLWLGLSIALVIGACLGAYLQPPHPDPFEPIGNSQLWYPIERNPHLRLLSISSDLYSVTFAADGRTGWAVGQFVRIFKTTDGGDTWEQRASLGNFPLESVTFADDALRGWAVGWSGTILKTTDAGDNWRRVNSTTSQDLSSVTFAGDGETGWAVGWNGTILKTTDAGDNWRRVNSTTSQDLSSVTFAGDGKTGWAVGQNGTILKSVDRGESWAPRASPTSERLESVTFSADGRTGWAVGPFPNIPIDGAQPVTILKTVDGGDTWERRIFPEPLILNSVTFAGDGLTGWAVGIDGDILKTVDAGESWERKRSGTSVDLESVTFRRDGRTGWIVGRNGTILKTKDGGETWFPRARGASDDFESVTFTDGGTTGWIVGRNGTILGTSNGGATWKPRHISTSEDITSEDSWRGDITSNDLLSVTSSNDGETGWAVGENGTILKTDNGGASWMPRDAGFDIDIGFLTSVTFAADDTTGWAVGWNNTVVRSTDGGDTWTQFPRRSPNTESVTSSVDGATAWAVGPSAGIVKITDGGQTWERLDSGTTAWLEWVTFSADGATGWVVGRRGTILKTADGGQTWERRSTDTAADLRSVAFTRNGTTGLAVGSNGTILRTTDGDTWTPSNAGLPSELESASFTSVAVAVAGDSVLGWTVGHDGAILNTGDGGATWSSTLTDYRKLPAPWTWIMFTVGILAALPARRRLPDPPPASNVADQFVSDRPIRTGEDTLQREPIAKALADVLHNPASEPPLTVAITGDWGQGKSSLMNLVHENLKSRNHNAVWFNAWHHQKERHMFASLMQSICEQALPPLFTRSGFRFYARLAGQRLSRHLFWTTLLLILLVICVGTLVFPDWLITTIELLPTLEGMNSSDGNTGVIVTVFLSLIPLPYTAWKVLVPDLKRVNPGDLLAATARIVRPKRFGNQLGFRHKFREALQEVVEAMNPQHLVITIDDLDRCRPEQVVDTLEAINFLADAAQCYVVFGIAREHVTRCVGLRFKDIAQEVSVVYSDEESKSSSNDDTERLKRADYARQYLEKIINLEVKIPRVSERDMATFIRRLRPRASGPAKTGREPGRLNKITQFITFVIVIVGLPAALLFVFGRILPSPAPIDETASESVTTVPSPPPQSPLVEISPTELEVREGSSEEYTVVLTEQPSLSVVIKAARREGDLDLTVAAGTALTFTPETWSVAQSVTVSATNDVDAGDGAAIIEHLVESGESRFHDSRAPSVRVTERDNDFPGPTAFQHPRSTRVPLATWLITLIAITVHLFVTREYLSRREEDHSQDSPEFKRALEIWHPVVRARTDSPRQFKRFVNRVRFLAALSRNRWRTEDPEVLPGDSLVVALAALQSVRHEAESHDIEEPIPPHVVAGLTDAWSLSEDAGSAFREWVHGSIRQVALQLPPDGRQAFCDRVLEELKKAIYAHQTSGEQATEEKVSHYNGVARLA